MGDYNIVCRGWLWSWKFLGDYLDKDYLSEATITTFIAIGLLIANKYRTKK